MISKTVFKGEEREKKPLFTLKYRGKERWIK